MQRENGAAFLRDSTIFPMIAHDDSSIADSDPWNRPRPQTAQWALSHAIFPGEVFGKNDPIAARTHCTPSILHARRCSDRKRAALA